MTSLLAPAMVSASEADFQESNNAMLGWALVMGVSLASFLVHLHPDTGLAAEHAGQGLLAMGAVVALAQAHGARFIQSELAGGDALVSADEAFPRSPAAQP